MDVLMYEVGDRPFEEAEKAAREEFPGVLFVVPSKANKLFVHVKADIDTETAALLSENNKLLGGTARLAWFEPYMEKDIRRAIAENQNPENMRKALRDVLGGDGPGSGLFGGTSPLERMLKNL